ncbi:MAG: hypothetical protein R3D90_04395 [Paracoccaceae bacterium]
MRKIHLESGHFAAVARKVAGGAASGGEVVEAGRDAGEGGGQFGAAGGIGAGGVARGEMVGGIGERGQPERKRAAGEGPVGGIGA